MINKFEAVGIFVSVACMALALFLLNAQESSSILSVEQQQTAAVISTNEYVSISDVYADSADYNGDVRDLIVDDIIVGTGSEIKEGDTVSVHYIGTLQNGQQFDNSYIKGKPFEFTLGEGEVMKGWDQGVVGMKVGGQRILVIPPELAYGKSGVGPIPANATLVFAVELLAIK